MTLPLPLKTPLLCWHESLTSARNDALIALSPHGARIATTRPLPAGTAVFLELEGGAGIDAVTTDEGDSTGFVVEFVTIDDAAAVLIERALRDSRVDVDDRAPLPPRNVTRPAAILSPPVAAASAPVVPEGHYATTLVPMFADEPAPVIAPPPPPPVTDDIFVAAFVAPVVEVVAPAVDVVVEEVVVAPVVEDVVVAPVVEDVVVASVVEVVVAPVVEDVVVAPVVEDVVVAPVVEEVVVAPVVEDVVVAPVVDDVVANEEISIADALRFELDEDDDADALGVAPPSLTTVELPVSSTPPPAMIVEPFDDLHSDDLGDVALGNFNTRPTSEAEFESAFFANDDGTPLALPTFADNVDNAVPGEPMMVPAVLEGPSSFETPPMLPTFADVDGEPAMTPAVLDGPSSFETPPMLPTFATAPVTEPALPRTRTDELFALQAAAPDTPLLSLPIPPPTRTRTAMLGPFDMPHTQPMGTLSADPDAPLPTIAATAPATPPPNMFDPPPAPTTSSRETTDKWPSARGILSSEDVAAVAAVDAATEDAVVVEEVAPPDFAAATLAPVVDVDVAEDVMLEFTDRRAVPVAAAEVERAQALLDGVGDAFAFDAFDDAIAAATAPVEAAVDEAPDDAPDDAPDVFASGPEPDVFGSDPEPDVFASAPVSDVFASAPDPEHDVFAASDHEAIDVEVEDDEVELDHRPAPTSYTSMAPVAEDNRPLPEPEPEQQESSVGVVDVDFSEFKDVLGAAHRAPAAMSTAAPPPSTLSSLSLPRPPPSTLPRPPMLPRAPGARETASFATSMGTSNPFGSGDSQASRLVDSAPPPPPSLPDDESWSPAGAATVFPAPRLLDGDLDPVLRAGGANSSIGTSSAPRGLPFIGDSSPLLAEPVIEHLDLPALEPSELSPLPPRRPGSTSQPDEIPVVVAAEDDDLPVIGGQVLDEDDWQFSPDTLPGRNS